MSTSQGQGNKGSGTQGGTSEQHAEAGRQSHKNDGKSSGSSGSSGASGGSKSSGSSGSSGSSSGSSGKNR